MDFTDHDSATTSESAFPLNNVNLTSAVNVNTALNFTVKSVIDVKKSNAEGLGLISVVKPQFLPTSLRTCSSLNASYLKESFFDDLNQLQNKRLQSTIAWLPGRNINLIDLLTLLKKCQLVLQKPDPVSISLDLRNKHCQICDHHGNLFVQVLNSFRNCFSVSAKENSKDFLPSGIETRENFGDTKQTQEIEKPLIVSSSGIKVDTPAKMKEEKAFEVILKSLVSGGVAGMCAKTTVAPLDRMKILLQAHSRHYSHLGVFSGLRGIVEKERFIALYKGNGAQMVRIFPYAATQFTSFEMYKKLFGENSHIGRFFAGSAAGVTAVALTYPLDTIRARLAFQVSGEHLYNGIYQCATHIFREEGGIRALYRGFLPTICGMVPYAGLSFYCFESFKYLCMKYFPDLTCKRHSTNTGGLVLLLPYKLLCGGVAGAAAQTVSYPLDVTRRRMQLAMMNESTKKFGMGMIPTLKMIYQENGVSRGLYRGMSINYLRAIPMVAVSFSTYELVKQMLSLDTGLPMKTG